jgi:plasmid stability protein
MANLTLSIDDAVLKAARLRAANEGTSVNDICRKAIEQYAQTETYEERLRRFDEWMARIDAVPPTDVRGPAWEGREKFYEEVLNHRLKTYLAGKK